MIALNKLGALVVCASGALAAALVGYHTDMAIFIAAGAIITAKGIER